MPVKRTFNDDWQDFRQDVRYRPVLLATAETFLLWERQLLPRNERPGFQRVWERAGRALIQLPQEFDSGNERFRRAKWRASGVMPGVPTTEYHGEHPWSKEGTRRLLKHVVHHAKASDPEVIAALAKILCARQDTVLLPHRKLSLLRIKSESAGDGLERYAALADEGLLFSRENGLEVDNVTAVDEQVWSRIAEAAESVGCRACDLRSIVPPS